MDHRILSFAERGELFARLAAWAGVDGQDRLTLMQIVGTNRLMARGGCIVADVTMEELCRAMSRGLSTVRASVSRLRQLALIERSEDERTVLDLSAVARQVGFVPGLGSGSQAAVCAEREVRIAPASSGERQLSGGHDRQNPGGSAPTRIDNNIINNLDSITAPASQLETRQIVDLVRMYQNEDVVQHVQRGAEIRELLRLVADMIGDRDWSEEALQEATAQAIPAVFKPCAAGKGISLATARAATETFGATLLVHAMYALARGSAPKGLLITLVRNRNTPAAYAANFLRKAAATALSAAEAEQCKGRLAALATAQESALETLRRLKEAALHVEGMSAEDRAAIVEGPRGYAELRHTAEEPTLVLGLLNKFDIVLWDRVVNRISSVSNQSAFPAIRIVNGALAGGRQVKIAEAWHQ